MVTVCSIVKRLLLGAAPSKKEEYTLSLACQMVVKCCLWFISQPFLTSPVAMWIVGSSVLNLVGEFIVRCKKNLFHFLYLFKCFFVYNTSWKMSLNLKYNFKCSTFVFLLHIVWHVDCHYYKVVWNTPGSQLVNIIFTKSRNKI